MPWDNHSDKVLNESLLETPGLTRQSDDVPAHGMGPFHYRDADARS